MQNISLVIFDMHDVLCHYNRTARMDDLEKLSGKPAAEIERDIFASGFEAEADAGKLDANTYLQGFGQRLGYPITLAEWLANRKMATAKMPEILDIMAAVKTRAKIAVLTNNHMLVRDHLEFLFPELYALCSDNFYVSAQFGVTKPSPEVYLRCCAAASTKPNETLFIDDSQPNVDSAVTAGLQGHHFNNTACLLQCLNYWNLLT